MVTRRQFMIGAAVSLAFKPARAAGMTSYVYVWAKLSDNIAISPRDGAAVVPHNGEMFALGGWNNGTTYNDVFRSTDGAAWPASGVARTWDSRHSFPAFSHGGRIILAGGDFNGSGYQNNIHSWDGLETSAWVEEAANVPWLNRVGHWGMSFGGYACVGGGQTMTPFTAPPSKVFSDIWISTTGLGSSWSLLTDKLTLGSFGYFCGPPAILDGEAYFINGMVYTTSDYPAKSYNRSIYAMDEQFNVRLVQARSPLPAMGYHSIAAWKGSLWAVAGHNGSANLNGVYRSDDKGETWILMPIPPWPATHAGALTPFNGSLYWMTGVDSGRGSWRLDAFEEGNTHYGSMPDTATRLDPTYTVVDRTVALTPGVTVASLGIYANLPHSYVPKIVKENSATNFDVVFNGSSGNHPGGSTYADFAVGFTIPSTGIYRMAFSFDYPVSDAFCTTGSRAMAAGDVTGNGVTFAAASDGTFPMRWTEA